MSAQSWRSGQFDRKFWNWTCNLPSFTWPSSLSSPRGGGPEMWLPSAPNWPPWQGHTNLFCFARHRYRTSEVWTNRRKNLELSVARAIHEHWLVRYDFPPSVSLCERELSWRWGLRCSRTHSRPRSRSTCSSCWWPEPDKGYSETRAPDHRGNRAGDTPRNEAKNARRLTCTDSFANNAAHVLTWDSGSNSCVIVNPGLKVGKVFANVLVDRFRSALPG